MKRCTGCGETKPRDQFYTTTSRGRPYASAKCVPCHNLASKERHDQRMVEDEKYKAHRFLLSIRQRCDKNNLPFDLDVAWILEKRRLGKCEVTGLPFDGEGDGILQRPWGFSLDRVEPSLGYTKANLKAVVWIYNRAKGCGSHDDVLRLCHALTYPQVES